MSIDNQFIKQLNNNPFLFLGSQGDFWTNAVYEKYFDGCQIDPLSMRTDPDFVALFEKNGWALGRVPLHGSNTTGCVQWS